MKLTCQQIREDWELFALGSLEPDEQEAIASHLAGGCEECARRFQEAQDSVTLMAILAPQVEPSRQVERKLEARIRKDLAPAESRWLGWRAIPWILAAACLAFAAWMAVEVRSLDRKLAEERESAQNRQTTPSSSDNTRLLPQVQPKVSASTPQSPAATPSSTPERQLEAIAADEARQLEEARSAFELTTRQLAEVRSELSEAKDRSNLLEKQLSEAGSSNATNSAQISQRVAELNSELAAQRLEVQRLTASATTAEQVAALLRSGNLQQIDLRAVDPGAGQSYARAFFSSKGGLLLVANRLPQLPERKCYQLWIVRKANPAIASAGLIQVQDAGQGYLYAPPSDGLNQLTALAITDEPEGGSLSARGHKLLFGAVGSR